MAETWYRVKGDEITPVEVQYHTEHFVMLANEYRPNGKRMARISALDCYFPTWGEAAKWIIVERAWDKFCKELDEMVGMSDLADRAGEEK